MVYKFKKDLYINVHSKLTHISQTLEEIRCPLTWKMAWGGRDDLKEKRKQEGKKKIKDNV